MCIGRKTKVEGDEEVGGFREKESRWSDRGRISAVAFVAEESSVGFVDDQSPWALLDEEPRWRCSKKNLGGSEHRRISVALLDGGNQRLSSTNKLLGWRLV
ncbi:hypothetical protein Bca52824_016918 [Brassica carinata]|uniref:Uncharacterized protein n=1 Tax=Brassica carinata TaxID=52824 RepID=A0A8X7VM43_BRACI|nr:hypothetical protein Bca52824_016918 [Brassica carinata]